MPLVKQNPASTGATKTPPPVERQTSGTLTKVKKFGKMLRVAPSKVIHLSHDPQDVGLLTNLEQVRKVLQNHKFGKELSGPSAVEPFEVLPQHVPLCPMSSSLLENRSDNGTSESVDGGVTIPLGRVPLNEEALSLCQGFLGCETSSLCDTTYSSSLSTEYSVGETETLETPTITESECDQYIQNAIDEVNDYWVGVVEDLQISNARKIQQIRYEEETKTAEILASGREYLRREIEDREATIKFLEAQVSQRTCQAKEATAEELKAWSQKQALQGEYDNYKASVDYTAEEIDSRIGQMCVELANTKNQHQDMLHQYMQDRSQWENAIDQTSEELWTLRRTGAQRENALKQLQAAYSELQAAYSARSAAHEDLQSQIKAMAEEKAAAAQKPSNLQPSQEIWGFQDQAPSSSTAPRVPPGFEQTSTSSKPAQKQGSKFDFSSSSSGPKSTSKLAELLRDSDPDPLNL